MRKRSRLWRLCAVVVILQVAAIAQTAFAATTVEKYHFSGESVSIYRDTWNDCAYDHFDIYATTSASRNNTPPAQSAYIYMQNYNYCTGSYASAYGEANPAWIQLVIQNTRSASLKGNIPMVWYTSEGQYEGNAAIDLQWKADSTPQRTTDSSRNRSQNYMYTKRTSSTSVKASVSGSISFDGNPFPLDGYFDAAIANNVSGEMTVSRLGGQPSQTSRLLPGGDKGFTTKLSSPKTFTNSKK